MGTTAATPAPPPVETIDDVPGSIFDANVVRAAAIRQLQEMEDRHNFNRRVWHLRAVENWKKNKAANSQWSAPIPQPPLAVHYQWVENAEPGEDGAVSNDPLVTEGPDLVAEPYIPPAKPKDLPSGVVAFGPPAEDGTGSFFAAANNTTAPGTHANKDGKEYVFVVLGRVGTLFYRKLWIPVGG